VCPGCTLLIVNYVASVRGVRGVSYKKGGILIGNGKGVLSVVQTYC
jgi:hypothetical protein